MAGNDKTVKDFNEYCKTNLHTMDNTKVCVVSLKRVYKESYPPFVTTEIEYKCTYGTTVWQDCVTRWCGKIVWQDCMARLS